jgi:NADPH-dependent 7-cyano-7-deazaguanine reductase QueF-like protein
MVYFKKGICNSGYRLFKSVFILVFILKSLDGKSQVEVLNKNIGWHGDVKLYSLKTSNPTQRVLFLFSEDSIRIMFLDRPDNLSKEFSIAKYHWDDYLGACMYRDNIYLFLRHRDPEGILRYIFDLKNESVDQSISVLTEGGEKVIGSLGLGEHFIYLTVDKKKSVFIFRSWLNEEFADSLQIPFKNDKVWNRLTFSTLVVPQTNIAKVYNEGESGDVIASKPNKLYLINDSAYFIMNNNDGIASVYGADLAAHRPFYKELIPNNIYTSGNKSVRDNYVDNSFLTGDKLYFVSATYDSLDLTVSDFKTGQVLKRFGCTKSDIIHFRNTPIIQEGSSNLTENLESGADELKEKEKTAQLLKKMVNTSVAVEAVADSGGIAITIGSSKNTITGDYDAPATNGHSSVWEPRTTWINSTHFRMLIDKNTFSHIAGDMRQSLNSRIDKYLKGMDVSKNGKTVLEFEGLYYLAYFDSKKRAVVIIKLFQ